MAFRAANNVQTAKVAARTTRALRSRICAMARTISGLSLAENSADAEVEYLSCDMSE